MLLELTMYIVGSSDDEKAKAINYLLNNVFFNKMIPGNFQYSIGTKYRRMTPISWNNESKIRYFYKFRPIFHGDQEWKLASYNVKHSMLASVVLDYNPVENENEIITNLRENYNKIIQFSKDMSKKYITLKNINIIYQGIYKEMLKHILISDKNLPSNIDVSSIVKISDDLTYKICKK